MQEERSKRSEYKSIVQNKDAIFLEHKPKFLKTHANCEPFRCRFISFWVDLNANSQGGNGLMGVPPPWTTVFTRNAMRFNIPHELISEMRIRWNGGIVTSQIQSPCFDPELPYV